MSGIRQLDSYKQQKQPVNFFKGKHTLGVLTHSSTFHYT